MQGGYAALYTHSVSFSVDDKSVKARVDSKVPTTMLAAAGITEMDVGTSSEVTIPENKKAEIALVLDYSGSMGDVAGTEVKYVAMRAAAIKLIDDIVKDNADKVKFALVPFSHHVYSTLPNEYVLGQGSSGNWTGCTQDRQYPFNLTDATPSASAESLWGQAIAPDHAAWGCAGYVSRNLKIAPLTDNFTNIKSQISSMTPYAYTHVPLGVEFGYHVLSPNAPYTEGVSYADKGTNKYLVVLTDGAQTEPAFGPGAVRTVAQGNSNLETICNKVKASGIIVISVAFDLDDTSQHERLKNCATNGAENFFVANNSADVGKAFEAITNAITAQAFLSK
jgi:von Willebrand factor type A domain